LVRKGSEASRLPEIKGHFIDHPAHSQTHRGSSEALIGRARHEGGGGLAAGGAATGRAPLRGRQCGRLAWRAGQGRRPGGQKAAAKPKPIPKPRRRIRGRRLIDHRACQSRGCKLPKECHGIMGGSRAGSGPQQLVQAKALLSFGHLAVWPLACARTVPPPPPPPPSRLSSSSACRRHAAASLVARL